VALSPTSSRSGAAASAGALTLLSTTTNVAAAQIDVSGISGSYNDLVLILIARSAETGTVDDPTIRLNNDSGANYYSERLRGSATSASAIESLGNTAGCFLGRIPAVSGVANGFGITQIVIPGYSSTTWLKTIQWQSFGVGVAPTTGNIYTQTGGGLWNSTAAVTRVQILSGVSAGFTIGSQLRIYGQL
jgi:hypothetical protein